jgi:lipoprotein LpqH
VKNRIVSVAWVVSVIVGIAGCSSSSSEAAPQPQGVPPPATAQVTVDGKNTGIWPAKCSQAEWLWLIDAGDQAGGVSAALKSGPEITLRSVEIRNLNGFSGSYWDQQGGNASAHIVGRVWVISGTIDGFRTDSGKRASATFEIKANC